jgi:signal transduction histidine kinase
VRLEENGLASALEELARGAGDFFKTRCEFHGEEPIVVSDPAVALHLYYIAQEAIFNAVKHGKANLIEVILAGSDGEGCTLTIRNDGAVLGTPSPRGRGMGIRIMKYRARMIGATLTIQSPPGGGTEVICQLGRPSNHSTNGAALSLEPAVH